jgi:EmrB/QacA subfamily drug resistance transporter
VQTDRVPANPPEPSEHRFGPGEGWGSWVRILRERPRPQRIRTHPRAHWFIVGTVCVGAFMGQLDASIATIALPAISHDLDVSVGSVTWVSLAYLLPLVGLVLPVGRLADSLGRKSLYLYGFLLFTVASLACGLAPGLAVLIIARIVQGAGAALMQANSVALIRAAVPPASLGRAIGIQGTAQAVGLAVGPTVGGLLLTWGSWRWLFWVAVPAGAIGWILGMVLLPRSRSLNPRPPADVPGLALLLGAVTLILLGLSRAAQPTPGPWPWLILALGLALTGVLRWWEGHNNHPLLDPRWMRDTGLGRPLIAGALTSATLFGVLFVVPFVLISLDHETTVTVGLLLSALPITIGATAPVTGWWADRSGSERVARVGALFAAVGLLVLTLAGVTAEDGPSVLLLGLSLVLSGIGLGLFTPANNATLAHAVPVRSAGTVAGLMNLSRGLGTALGVAIAAVIYSASARPQDGLRDTAAVLAVAAVAAWFLSRGVGPGGRTGPDPTR